MAIKSYPKKKSDFAATELTNICRSLHSWFDRENPPADEVAVIPESVSYVDPKYRMIKALVRTSSWTGKISRKHVSNIRVKLDEKFHIVPLSLSFV